MNRGEIAERAGVNGETLRYYEKRGLIPEPDRSASGYRIYTNDDLDRIQFIKRTQRLGFTLREVEELLRLQATEGADAGDIRQWGVGPTESCPILNAINDHSRRQPK